MVHVRYSGPVKWGESSAGGGDPDRGEEPVEVPPPHRPVPDGEPVTPIIPGRPVPGEDDRSGTNGDEQEVE